MLSYRLVPNFHCPTAHPLLLHCPSVSLSNCLTALPYCFISPLSNCLTSKSSFAGCITAHYLFVWHPTHHLQVFYCLKYVTASCLPSSLSLGLTSPCLHAHCLMASFDSLPLPPHSSLPPCPLPLCPLASLYYMYYFSSSCFPTHC
jgi:hypothetical protein